MGVGSLENAHRPAVSRPVFLLPTAEGELLGAQAWYGERVAGLGGRFTDGLDAVVARIGEAPLQFPVALYYRVEPDGVFVIPCVHTSRAADGWRTRV